MTDLEVSKSILEKIIVEGLPFTIAIRNGFKTYSTPNTSRGNISALLGCELRHHLLLDNLMDRYFDNPKFEDTVYLRFYIVNRLYLHRYSNDELYPLAVQSLPKDKVDLLIEFISSTRELIPTEYDKSSPDFLSLRFNTPSWVIRMWQKQYGRGLTYNILRANYHQSNPSVRVNDQLISVEEVLNRHPDFAKSEIENILIFNGHGSPSHFEEFKQNKIFFMKMATKYVIDRLEIEPLKGIAIYCDVSTNIYLDLVSRFGKDIAIDAIIKHGQFYFESKKVVEALKCNNIRLYNESASSLITCVSKKVNLMFCLPRNSHFDLFRSVPDYFLRIKQEQLDEFIKEENEALDECSKLIEVDGILVYMVPTICKKESMTLIGDFLFEHPDFELVEEKQFLPFESLDSCLYYAILRRKGENNTDD